MGPDPTGLVSLYEEETRTQTCAEEEHVKTHGENAVCTPRSEAQKEPSLLTTVVSTSSLQNRDKSTSAAWGHAWYSVAHCPQMSMRGVQHPQVVAEGAQQCVEGASGYQ